MPPDTLELQLVRIDGRLDHHVELFETLLAAQQKSLELIREDLKEHHSMFITFDSAKLMAENVYTRSNENTEDKVAALEVRLVDRAKLIGSMFVASLVLVFGLIEIIPLVHIGG